MSNLKDKLAKQVKKIDNTITNQSEKETVLEAVQNMINIFAEQVINVSERQQEIEEKIEDVYEVLTTIEEEMIATFGSELEGECPYCGETIQFTLPEDDGNEIECPYCNNSIELELMMEDYKHSCKGGKCGCDCDDDCDDDCDCGHHNEQ